MRTLAHRDDQARAKIGLSVSVSPHQLKLDSTEPFYIAVAARILESGQPDKPITLQTLPTPFEDLPSPAFTNMICTTEDKRIRISPPGPPQWRWDEDDLRSELNFVTIPAKGNGTYTIRHEVPRGWIEDAQPAPGEHYRFRVTDKSLHALWWAFASLDELEGVRLKTFQTAAMKKAAKGYDSGQLEDMEERAKERYGGAPVCEGEAPAHLSLVLETGEVQFEVV